MTVPRRGKVTAASPGEADIAGLYRLAAGVIGVCALASTVVALAETSLPRTRRLLALAVGVAATGASVRGYRDGRLPARLIHERPGVTVCAGLFPLAASPFLGGHRTPLWMLAVSGTGVSAAVAGQRRGLTHASGAAAFWLLQAAAVSGWSEVRASGKAMMTFVVIPLAFVASGVTGHSILQLTSLSRGLQRTLDRTERDLAALDEFRDEIDDLMQPLRASLRDLREDVLQIEDDALRTHSLADIDRAAGRLAERVAILDTLRERPASAEALVLRRVAQDAHLTDLPVDVEVAGAAGTRIEHAALLIAAAFLPGTISNAARYAEGASRIRVRLEVDANAMVLEVSDDAPEVRPWQTGAGSGLMTLKTRAEQLDGSLERIPGEQPGFGVRLVLPVREARGPSVTVTDEMFLAVDEALRWSVLICGVMVLAMSAGDEALMGDRRRLWGVANSALALAYEALEESGRLRYRPPAERSKAVTDAVTALLAAAAVVTAAGPHGEHAVLSGWVGAALARHAMVIDQRTLRRLTAANIAALLPSFRGSPQEFVRMLGHQATVTAMGPAVVTYRVRPATIPLQEREWALEDAWSEGEQLHRLALAFETRHGWKDPAERVMRTLGDMPSTRRLGELLKRSQDAGAKLAEASGGYLGLAEEMAQTLAEQVWPASVVYSIDGDSFRTFPTEAIQTVAFRRDALAIARAIGEAVEASRPPDRLGRRGRADVELELHLNGFTSDGAVRCTIAAAPPVAGGARERLRDAVEDASGNLLETGPEALLIDLFPSAYVDPGD